MFNFAVETNIILEILQLMKQYLILLNVVLWLALISGAWWLSPVIGGWPLVAGLFAGGMFTAGMTSWQYDKDESPDKDWKWRRGYFHKEYPLEIVVQTVLGSLCFGLSYLFWAGFWHFLTGFFAMWLLNLIVEWGWALAHPHYNRK